MKKAFAALLLTALFVTTFALSMKPARAPAYAVHFTNPYPFNSLWNAVNFGGLSPGDHLHILAGHVETLPGSLVVPVPNLWIIGTPPMMGATPLIDVASRTISVAGANISIWGINFWDSNASSPLCIELTPTASRCIIQACGIYGKDVNGSMGIMVNNSLSNFIACNRISGWQVGINVWGPLSNNNIIKLNDINDTALATGRGVQVGGGAGAGGPNQVFWNDIIGIPCPPGSGLGHEFWDVTPANPLNIFDDLAQPAGSIWSRGNFESSWAIPPPYSIVGPGMNGWSDRLPNLGNTPIVGDVDLNGQVDILDAIRLANKFAKAWCTMDWDPRVDVRPDGVIDIYDAILLATNFGRSYPPSPVAT